MQGGIKRPLLYLKNIARHLLNPLGYGPSMLRPECKRSQDKEVQSALRKIDSLGRHVFPFHFYMEQYTSSCRSARVSCIRQKPAGFEDRFCNLSRV